MAQAAVEKERSTSITHHRPGGFGGGTESVQVAAFDKGRRHGAPMLAKPGGARNPGPFRTSPGFRCGAASLPPGDGGHDTEEDYPLARR